MIDVPKAEGDVSPQEGRKGSKKPKVLQAKGEESWGFFFYSIYYEILNSLKTYKARWLVFDAIYKYITTGRLPCTDDFTPRGWSAFEGLLPLLKFNKGKYDEYIKNRKQNNNQKDLVGYKTIVCDCMENLEEVCEGVKQILDREKGREILCIEQRKEKVPKKKSNNKNKIKNKKNINIFFIKEEKEKEEKRKMNFPTGNSKNKSGSKVNSFYHQNQRDYSGVDLDASFVRPIEDVEI